MKINLPNHYWEVLACPNCGNSLTNFGEKLKCTGCTDEYTSELGLPDLRLQRKKTVMLQFDLGCSVFPDKSFEFEPLGLNNHPEVDYSGVKVPFHFTREQLSFLPRAKSPDSLMLDLGCGHAIHKEIVEHAGFKYVAVDYDEIDAPMLADGHALPFKDNSFEFIMSIAVLEHIINPFVMMKEALRVLKPGGKIFGTVAFLEPFHANSCYHHSHLGTYYTLKASGFNVEKVAPSAAWSVLMAQSGFLFCKLPKPLPKIIVMPVYLLHRLWWKVASVVSSKASEHKRVLFATGSFTFIANKPK